VAAGNSFGLALKSDGTVWSWGDNFSGQLGTGDKSNTVAVPVRIDGISGVIAVAAGSEHGLALKKDGTVWVWGNNQYGQLGDNDADSDVPIQIENLTGVIAIAASCNHNLALKQDGTVWSWGWNFTGQLGHDYRGEKSDFNDFDPPKQIKDLNGVIAISAGGSHSLALKRDGTVWSWGNNGFGQLGNGNYDITASPIQVTAITDVTVIIAGAEHSMALKHDGSLWVWGNNEDGQLGNGSGKDSNLPLLVPGLNGVIAIAASGHVLAVKSDGTVWGWGFNKFGQVGGTAIIITQPMQISGL
jgi:alpha-tubulin suppressor-like RCC1 family protein